MRAVWSFWTKPWQERAGWTWLSEKHHLLAWVLSVENAQKHYPQTSLVTDDAGAKLLVDELGLTFDSVSTTLNSLAGHDPRLWMLGKLQAYRAQQEPFVHLDTDVILWNRLPAHLESAAVFAQNPEPFTLGASDYKPDQLQRFLTQQTPGWLPPEWEWSLSLGLAQRGENCGIMGGNHLEFIQHYAEGALALVEDARNHAGWSLAGDKCEYNTTIEQFYLSACLEFHGDRPGSSFRDVAIRYLFDSCAQAFNPHLAARAGFTHLLSVAKQHPRVAERLEQRVQRDHPEQYERCLAISRQCGQ